MVPSNLKVLVNVPIQIKPFLTCAYEAVIE